MRYRHGKPRTRSQELLHDRCQPGQHFRGLGSRSGRACFLLLPEPNERVEVVGPEDGVFRKNPHHMAIVADDGTSRRSGGGRKLNAKDIIGGVDGLVVDSGNGNGEVLVLGADKALVEGAAGD